MLTLLRLPLFLLQVGFYALCAFIDLLRGRKGLHLESTVLIDAPRDLVWRFSAGDRMVFDGPPVVEVVREPIAGSEDLFLFRSSVSGQPQFRFVCRRIELDEARGTSLYEVVPHDLSVPPNCLIGCLERRTVEERQGRTAFTISNDLESCSFREHIMSSIGMRRCATLIKRQCEKAAGTQSRLKTLADHGLVLSIAALLSFWSLLGWKEALGLAIVVLVHEAGHAIAMRMAGVEVRGICLIPFFGGACVPKTSYRTEGRFAFIALMGPAFSLIPTLGLVGLYLATDDIRFLQAAWLFAIINVVNLLPVLPLDGGVILNSLLGSISRRVARAASWIAMLAVLGHAIYWQSLLIGITVLVCVVLYCLSGPRGVELEPLSLPVGTTLVLGSAVTCAAYLFVIDYSYSGPPARAAARLTSPDAVVLYVDSELADTDFVAPLACSLKRVLAVPVSTRSLRLPRTPDLAATATQLDANRLGERFAAATAAEGSPRTQKFLLLGDDLKIGRANVFAMFLGDAANPRPNGLLSTARLHDRTSNRSRGEDADVTAKRAYKLILRMSTRIAGYNNPAGCVLAFHNGGTDDLDHTPSGFCEWDQAVLARAGLLKAEAGPDCPAAPRYAATQTADHHADAPG